MQKQSGISNLPSFRNSFQRKRSSGNITDGIDARLPPRKIVRVVSAPRLRDDQAPMSPLEYLKSSLLAQGLNVSFRAYQSIPNFFESMEEEGIDSYSGDVLAATRKGDVEQLRAFHKAGRPLKCANKFGESLLHLACRRSQAKVVDFLINEALVPCHIVDDMGRTPLSDAFWTPEPNFAIVDLILGKCPDLLYVNDKRGHSPLSYARREHWSHWIEFLKERPKMVIPRKLSP